MTNKNKLKARMVELGYTLQTFAEAAGMSLATLSAKLNGHGYFNVKEISKIVDLLDIASADIPAYFFASLVPAEGTEE